jgi:hypothetical protein
MLPYLLVMGPLTCGFYHCAFEAFANRPVRSELLNRGMDSAGSSIPAWLLIFFINLLPLLLVYGAFVVLLLAMGVAAGPPGPPGAQGPNPQEPPPEFFLGILAFYLGMFVAMFLMLIWQLWFSTRTMFILPLIADRRMGVAAAWSASWRETRKSFWELLVLNVAAQISAVLGAYFMYVGLLVTVPFAITLRTSVYLERFGVREDAGDGRSADPALESP